MDVAAAAVHHEIPDTYSVRVGDLKKGSHVVIDGHPCKVRG